MGLGNGTSCQRYPRDCSSPHLVDYSSFVIDLRGHDWLDTARRIPIPVHVRRCRKR